MSKSKTTSNKGLRMLGLSTEHLIEVFLGPRNGELGRDEADMFWSAFSYDKYLGPRAENEKATKTFITSMLNLLIDVLDETKTIRMIFRGFPIQSLINTLSFAQFFLPVKADAALEKILKKWNGNKAKYSLSCPSSDELMRVMCKRFLDKEDAIDTLVVQCGTLHTLDEFAALSDDMQYSTLSDDDNKNAGERTFVYSYLREWVLHNKSRQFNLLETILLKMRTFSQQLKISPKMSETALVASFHIVKQMLALNPVTDINFLQNSFAILEQYYLWPKPFGSQAREMLNAWRNELVAPGHNMRVRLMQETRMVALKHQNRSYPIFYIFDASDHISAGWSTQMNLDLWSSLLDTVNGNYNMLLADNPRDMAVPLMAHLILNMFANDKLLKDSVVQSMRRLKSSCVVTFFAAAHQIMLSTLSQKVENAPMIRVAALMSLLEELENAARNPSYSSDPSEWYIPNNDEPLFDVSEEYVPVPLPTSHIAIPECVSFNMPEPELIDQYGMTPFPHTPMKDILIDLYSLSSNGATLDSPSQLSIAICGGPHVLHAVMCAYVDMFSTHGDLCKLVEPKFILLPFVSNHLANYIARHDAWYNRHILTPFRSDFFLLPKTQAPFPAQFASDGNLTRLGTFYRSLTEQYARESSSILPVTVFKAAAWCDSLLPVQAKRYVALSDHMIPFMQRLEIGFTTSPVANRTPPSLRVQFSRVDMHGQSLGTFLDESITYQHVILSHIPIVRDVTFPANPAAGFLEFYAYLSEISKTKSKTRETRAHVNQVEISSSDPSQLFNVVIDGNQFGPYCKLLISPHFENGSHCTFPISTFFPLPSAN